MKKLKPKNSHLKSFMSYITKYVLGWIYSCGTRNDLYEPFKKRCNELKIYHKMKDIVKGAEDNVTEKQVSLF